MNGQKLIYEYHLHNSLCKSISMEPKKEAEETKFTFNQSFDLKKWKTNDLLKNNGKVTQNKFNEESNINEHNKQSSEQFHEKSMNKVMKEPSSSVSNSLNQAPKWLTSPIIIARDATIKTYDFTDGSNNDTHQKVGNSNFNCNLTTHPVLSKTNIDNLESRISKKQQKDLAKFNNRVRDQGKVTRKSHIGNQHNNHEDTESHQNSNELNESLIETRIGRTLVSRNYRIPVLTRPRRTFLWLYY